MSGFDSKDKVIGQQNAAKKQLDKTDWAILRELQTDGRLSWAEIGRRVGLSSPAVQERVRKLEDSQVITGYRAVVNPKHLGYPITAVIRFGASQNEQRLRRYVEELPYVIDSYCVLGSDAYIVRVAVPNIEELWRICEPFHDICVTTTAVITEIVADGEPITRDFGAEAPPKS